MDNQGMSDRHNRTVYISDFLFQQANSYAEKKDRSASRIIEYALAAYLKDHGTKIGAEYFDPEATP